MSSTITKSPPGKEKLKSVVQTNEDVLASMEELGYNSDYVIASVKMNDKNHCTTAYYLLLAQLDIHRGKTSISK
jgi:hypothetical protein